MTSLSHPDGCLGVPEDDCNNIESLILDSIDGIDGDLDMEGDQYEALTYYPGLRRGERQTAGTALHLYGYDQALLEVDSDGQKVIIPTTYVEAMSSENSGKWKEALELEFHSLTEMETWELVQPPPRLKPPEVEWAFDVQLDGQGDTYWYNARLLAKVFPELPASTSRMCPHSIQVYNHSDYTCVRSVVWLEAFPHELQKHLFHCAAKEQAICGAARGLHRAQKGEYVFAQKSPVWPTLRVQGMNPAPLQLSPWVRLWRIVADTQL